MDVTLDTGNGIETNDVGAVQVNDDEFIPADEALKYAELEYLYIRDRTPATYTPGSYYDGIKEVELAVDYRTGTVEITENGTYQVSGMDAWDLVEIDCTGGEYDLHADSLKATHNGLYKPPRDGFSSVEVDMCKAYSWETDEFEDAAGDMTSRYVYYDGYMYQLGGDNPKTFKRLEIDEWVDVGELPYDFFKGGVIVIKGRLHILGTGVIGKGNLHYSWDGEEWREEKQLPSFLYNFSCVEHQGYLYIIGGHSSYQKHNGYANFKMWKLNLLDKDAKWIELAELPDSCPHQPAFSFNNKVIFVKEDKMYSYDREWSESQMPIMMNAGFLCDDGMDEKIHIIGEDLHYSWDGTNWNVEPFFDLSLNGKYDAVVADDIFYYVYLLGVDNWRLECEREY